MDKNTEYGLSGILLKKIKNTLDLNLKTQTKNIVSNLHPADQADLIYNLNKEQRIKLINIFRNQLDPEILIELQENVRNDIILLIDKEDLKTILSKLDVDDVVCILGDLHKQEFVKEIIEGINQNSKRELIEEYLSYPEDTVGRILGSNEYIAVPQDWTIEEVIKYMQKNRSLTNELSEIVIVDDYYRPVSTASIIQLLKNEPNKKMFQIMRNTDELRILRSEMKQEEAAILFNKYNLFSAPVVNDNGVLIGVLYLNDIIDIINEEAEEDLLLMGNLSEDDTYSNIFKAARKRFPWLIVTILTTTIGSSVINSFSSTVEKIVCLAALMPLIAGIGGIASTQTLTVIVRNIASGKLKNRNNKKIVLKEAFTGLVNGIGIGLFGGLGVFIWQKNLMLSFIFFITLTFVLFLGGLMASIIPIILDKLKFDPAVSSGSFITTTVDSLSFLLILKLASTFL